MEWIILLFTFLTVFLLVLAAASLVGLVRQPVDERIRRWENPERRDMASAFRSDPRDEGVLASFGKRVAPKKPEQRSESFNRLRRAGFYTDFAFHVYWAFKILLTLGAAGLASIFFLVYGIPNQQILLMGLILIGAALFFPDFYLYLRWRWRQEQIFCGLPDALDLLVVCIESGLGLDSALQRISQEFHHSNPVLSNELKLTCGAVRLGQARSQALHELAERNASPDLKSLVSVLIQSERFGTSLAQALRVHADDMRTRRRQRAEEMAAKTTVKLIFPLVLFIFPAIFVVLAGPAAIRIIETFMTHQ